VAGALKAAGADVVVTDLAALTIVRSSAGTR
jgi:hypothetical protein